MSDLLITNIGELVTATGNRPIPAGEVNLNVLRDAAVFVSNGKIKEIGLSNTLEEKYPESFTVDVDGRTVIPGFVDPHTHLVYAGCRHEEFLEKLRGASYTEILKKGGGINSTVRATRNASRNELLRLALERARIMFEFGTTTIEIKSGYGLNYDDEKKILEVANELREKVPQDIVVTFLGAHTVPFDFYDRRKQYIELLLKKMIPDFRGLAEFFDIFIEDGAFSPEEARMILKVAKESGYYLKVHADQLNDLGGGGIAADFDAISAEHLDYVSEESLEKMGKSGTIGVLLPTSTFFLRLKKAPPVELFRKYHVPMALATDHNPGTSPFYSMQSAMVMGVFNFGMTPEEAFVAATLNAAFSIRRGGVVGSIEPGKKADLLILNTYSWVHLFYEPDKNHVEYVIKNGEFVYEKGENKLWMNNKFYS